MYNLVAAFCIGLMASPVCAFAADISASEGPAAVPSGLTFGQIAQQCAPLIHVRTLASLVRQESQFNPFAININSGRQLARQPATQAEAVMASQMLLAQGYNIDVGLGQINSRNFQWTDMSLAQLFNPCNNLRTVAQMLSDCYARGAAAFGLGQSALHAALSCYNTGSLHRGIDNGYVHHIMAQAALPVPELLPVPQIANATLSITAPESRTAKSLALPEPDAEANTKQDDEDVFFTSEDPDVFSVKTAQGIKYETNQN
jgi:type IV secretion system protein VirB1